MLLIWKNLRRRRRRRRERQKEKNRRRSLPESQRSQWLLDLAPTQKLLKKVPLITLPLVFLFQFILIQFLLLLPKPHNKLNHLLLTHPHKFQLPFHLHPYKQKPLQSSPPLLNRYQQSILTSLIQKLPNPFLLIIHFHPSLNRVILK